jgi:hypothetical protein
LQFELEGLSFAARAVLATATALTYEFGDQQIAVRVLKRCLGLSDDAWESAYGELADAGHLQRVPDRYGDVDLVELYSSFDILSKAMGAGGRPSAREWRELRSVTFAEFGERCTYCGTTSGPFALDHVVPVSRGGSNHYANLTPACVPCNASKGSRTLEEWRAAK